MSADDRKRLEYEAREKAVRDYNTQMKSSLNRGIKRGEKRLNFLNEQLLKANRMDDLVRAISDEEYQQKLYAEFGL